ncbi:MAG: hypothetical protein AMXMBFR13_09520 [Phycisphaerae bacterium]
MAGQRWHFACFREPQPRTGDIKLEHAMIQKTMRAATRRKTDEKLQPQLPTGRILPEVVPPTKEQWAVLDEADRDLLERVLREPVEFTPHGMFENPQAETMLFGKKATLGVNSTYFHEPPVEESPLERAGGGGTLSSAEEVLLFQRYNYARMRQVQYLVKYRHKRMPTGALHHLLGWAHRAMIARGQIAQANVPLVLAMAKRTRLSGLDFNELISEGNFALLRSIDKFDCSRGFKFSTYACRAILKSFARVAIKTGRYRNRFPVEFDPSLEKSDFTDKRRDGVESDCVEEIRDIMAQNRAALNDIEQTVIRERFALEQSMSQPRPKTLEQVGAMIGVTKERVRQIQNKALQKIRTALEDDLFVG